MLFKSALVTQASGSIGGMTAGRTRSGMYMRGRGIPVNPNTVKQQEIRNAVLQASTRWSQSLTDAQRAAWDLYAANTPVINKLGDSFNLSGQNMYIRSITPRIQAGISTTNTAPTTFGLPNINNLQLAGIADPPIDFDISWSDFAEWAETAGSVLLLYLGRPVSTGRTFFKGPYRYAGKIAGSASTPPTSPTSVTFIAGQYAYASGQKVFGYCRVTDGEQRLSPKQFIGPTIAT